MNREDLIKIAKLSNIDLTMDEVDSYRENLGAMVEFISTVENWQECDECPKECVKTTLREDVPEDSLPREEILKNAPLSQKGFFCVKERG